MKALRLAVAASALLLTAATVHAETIDFENIAAPGEFLLNGSFFVGNNDAYFINGSLAAVAASNMTSAAGVPNWTSDFFAFCTCGSSIQFDRQDGGVFSLQGFDVSGSGKTTLHLAGEKANGATVTFDYTQESGAWSGVDMSAAGFTNLKSVTITGSDAFSIALDNIRVSQVPVPATAWLFGSSLVGLAARASRRNKR